MNWGGNSFQAEFWRVEVARVWPGQELILAPSPGRQQSLLLSSSPKMERRDRCNFSVWKSSWYPSLFVLTDAIQRWRKTERNARDLLSHLRGKTPMEKTTRTGRTVRLATNVCKQQQRIAIILDKGNKGHEGQKKKKIFKRLKTRLLYWHLTPC